MSIIQFSRTNLELYSASAHSCIELLKFMDELLAGNHDLSPEQLQFWIRQRESIYTMAAAAISAMENLTSLHQTQRQQTIDALVPFINGRNPDLN